ncbi:MAG: hypothetical protein KBD65_02125 [Candidatus Moranbacteria bacterium]|nr:hypothetical protein [Candidatus Moranbacteria bacterium]
MWKRYAGILVLAIALCAIGFLMPMEFDHFIIEPEKDYPRTFFLWAVGLETFLFFLRILILYHLFIATGIGLLLGMAIESPRNWCLIKKPYKFWKKAVVSCGLFSLLIVVMATTTLAVSYVVLCVATVYTVRFVSTETHRYLQRKRAELNSPPTELAA